MTPRLSCLAVGLLAALALAGCKKKKDNTNPCACTVCVDPSGLSGGDDHANLQTAFIEAGPDSSICLGAGTFHLNTTLTLANDRVTVQGAGPGQTILDFSGQTVGPSGIDITGDHVDLVDFAVRDTPGDGIKATGTTGISFIRVDVTWTAPASLQNGAYGLYPVGCSQVLVDDCLVVGARDAGIYVGQSDTILVRDNEVHGNVAGIEIENSTNAEVVGNYAHDNTAGILVFNLPELPVQDGRRALIHDNVVENNNLANFADPGTIVANVPAGAGIMILAADENEITGNTITGNGSIGVVIVSYVDALYGFYNDAAYDIYPQTNYVHDNTFTGNGTDPQGIVLDFTNQNVVPLPVPDVVWDGCQDASAIGAPYTNCVDGVASYYNFDYCGGFLGGTSDASDVTCTHPALPNVTIN